MTAFFTKIMAFFMTIVMFLFPRLNVPEQNVDADAWQTEYPFVFVHGLGGWGEYDPVYRLYPYWGGATGDLMKYLNARGFTCCAASVTQNGSVWDRACELYAQLTGTRVDYGAEHSARCNHSRYGRDYSYFPLVKAWDSENKINLLGHSFGGNTIVMLQGLLANGSEAERAVTPEDELSGLFTGGKGDWIYSITTLSSPLKGTSAYSARDEINVDPDATGEEKGVVALLSGVSATPHDGRVDYDGATRSLSIDGARELADVYVTLPDCYYFAFATCYTETGENGVQVPESDMELLFRASSTRMGKFIGETPEGFPLDEEWWANDGLVNVYSAIAPFDMPTAEYTEGSVEPGVWNVMPTTHGDHTYFMGGLTKVTNLRETYFNHLQMINGLG